MIPVRPARPLLLPALLAAALALPLLPGASAAATPDAPARIVVTGEGRTDASPDMATITLGVQTEATTAGAALRENSARLSAVLARLREGGVAPRDLQTSGLSLGPVMDYRADGGARLRGYQASNQLSVRVRDLGALGGILDLAVSDGANQFHGLAFGLSEPGAAMDAARVAAVHDARRKAEMLAEAAGTALGPVIEITEAMHHMPPRPMMARAAMDAAVEAVPVAEGEVTYSVSVTITWALAGD